MGTKKVEIEVPEGKTAEWIDGVLTLVDEKDTRPVTERVKTFDDACNELGEYHPLVRQWHGFENNILSLMDYTANDIVAYMKLRIICAALNEGWEPKFTEDEWRYYPWFYLYTKEEFERLDDDTRNSGVRFGGYVYRGPLAGFVYVRSASVPSSAGAALGYRLCLKNRELSVYCGKQFVNIWADFILIGK